MRAGKKRRVLLHPWLSHRKSIPYDEVQGLAWCTYYLLHTLSIQISKTQLLVKMASESGRFANLMEEDLQQIIDNKDLWGEIFMRYSKTNTTWFTSRSSENSRSLSVGCVRLLPSASRREVVSSIQHLGTSNFYYFPQSKMEYASSAWIGATPTSLAQLDSIQNRAKRVTCLPSNKYEDHRIQPLSHRRTISYVLQRGPWAVMPADARYPCPWPQVATVCEIPWPSSGSPKIEPCQPCKIISTIYGAIMNSLPAQVPAIRSRASFSREVNHFLGATSSAASKWFIFLCC